MRIALYARVSTVKQAEKTYPFPISCGRCATGARPIVTL